MKIGLFCPSWNCGPASLMRQRPPGIGNLPNAPNRPFHSNTRRDAATNSFVLGSALDKPV